ncbi:protein FAM200A-like [Palaemon carinicauda]|uniref:protein FAM200A-like n=1 Tax=Palaemon carinicauda TaxID=392227 RepID=UPI0035B608F8
MIGEEAVSEMNKDPVSDNAFSKRVNGMSRNISDILSEILKHAKFALQVDESTDITENLLNLQEEEEITELKCDRTLRIKFNEVLLDVFWISIREEYPVVSAKALDILLQSSTSYLCEQGFSCLTTVKSISRNQLLSVEEELRVCLSEVRPNIEKLGKEKQAQVSH